MPAVHSRRKSRKPKRRLGPKTALAVAAGLGATGAVAGGAFLRRKSRKPERRLGPKTALALKVAAGLGATGAVAAGAFSLGGKFKDRKDWQWWTMPLLKRMGGSVPDIKSFRPFLDQQWAAPGMPEKHCVIVLRGSQRERWAEPYMRTVLRIPAEQLVVQPAVRASDLDTVKCKQLGKVATASQLAKTEVALWLSNLLVMRAMRDRTVVIYEDDLVYNPAMPMGPTDALREVVQALPEGWDCVNLGPWFPYGPGSVAFIKKTPGGLAITKSGYALFTHAIMWSSAGIKKFLANPDTTRIMYAIDDALTAASWNLCPAALRLNYYQVQPPLFLQLGAPSELQHTDTIRISREVAQTKALWL